MQFSWPLTLLALQIGEKNQFLGLMFICYKKTEGLKDDGVDPNGFSCANVQACKGSRIFIIDPCQRQNGNGYDRYPQRAPIVLELHGHIIGRSKAMAKQLESDYKNDSHAQPKQEKGKKKEKENIGILVLV